ncbi:MAG TPA: cadherin-like domain-containing protein, partial [Chloroflexota bacterium]|nr:cadherin-like domain-containing protein [Chloroflexota bacterium]
MDEVRFWGVARTPEQIAASYAIRTRQREIGLLGAWQFDKGSGTTAVDSSAADGRDGTLVNGPLWVLSGAQLGIPTNSAPIATGESYTTAEDTTLSVSAPGVLANDSDPDGDALDISLQSGPSHGTLALNANGSFNYTPTPNYNGTDSFTYKIGDGSPDFDTATVSITITPVQDPPIAVNDSFPSMLENATLVYNGAFGVLHNDSDADSDPLTVSLVAGPAGGTLSLGSDGSFTYSPGDFNGTANFTYRVCDPSNA